MVRPILEYGSPVFDNCGIAMANALEAVQFEAARICTGALKHTTRNLLLIELGWQTLATRRKYFKLLLFYKMFFKLCPVYLSALVPHGNITRTLRNAQNLRQPKCRTDRFYNSFLPSSIRLWNNLPLEIRNSLPETKFKLNLKQTLLATDNVPVFYSYGNRFANIIQTQMKLGHSPLNHHLFRFNLVESPLCNCGISNETVPHYFLECSLHAAPRLKLFMGLRNILAPRANPFLLPTIAPERTIHIFLYGIEYLQDNINEEIFQVVQSFILDTRRFFH